MLAIFRIFIFVIYLVLVCIIGCFWCILDFKNPNNAARFSHIFGYLSLLFGIKVEVRLPSKIRLPSKAMYISNHQNNYDLITIASAVQPNTITVGKKSLLWIPFFGQLYWLTGNLVIDRHNKRKSYATINKITKYFKEKEISFWIFPEGTRNRGRDLLPFKTGAFKAAIFAKVPIVPVVISNTHKKIKLNRYCNGLIIIEILSPIDTLEFKKESAGDLAKICHKVIKDKFNELNLEIWIKEKN